MSIVCIQFFFTLSFLIFSSSYSDKLGNSKQLFPYGSNRLFENRVVITSDLQGETFLWPCHSILQPMKQLENYLKSNWVFSLHYSKIPEGGRNREAPKSKWHCFNFNYKKQNNRITELYFLGNGHFDCWWYIFIWCFDHFSLVCFSEEKP